MLLYPVLDCTMETPSMKKFTDTPLWNSVNNKIMWDIYLKGHQQVPEYASPMQANSVKDLPPAYIEPAEFCCLRDEAINYAQRLKEEGIKVEVHQTKGTAHLFDIIENSEISKAALQKRITTLQNVFKSI